MPEGTEYQNRAWLKFLPMYCSWNVVYRFAANFSIKKTLNRPVEMFSSQIVKLWDFANIKQLYKLESVPGDHNSTFLCKIVYKAKQGKQKVKQTPEDVLRTMALLGSG